MSRGNTTAMDAALSGSVHRAALLGAMHFDSGTIRLWSGIGDLVWGGDTFSGLGNLLGIEYPQEASDGAAHGAVFTLSGVDSSWNAIALSEHYQGRLMELWYAEFDEDGALIDDPLCIFTGIIDQMVCRDDGQTSEVTLTAERRTLDNRPPGGTYDHATQQRLFPGDKFLEGLAAQQEVAVNWGVPDASNGNGNSRAPGPPQRGPGNTGHSPPRMGTPPPAGNRAPSGMGPGGGPGRGGR